VETFLSIIFIEEMKKITEISLQTWTSRRDLYIKSHFISVNSIESSSNQVAYDLEVIKSKLNILP
jgi:hypothetical protein